MMKLKYRLVFLVAFTLIQSCSGSSNSNSGYTIGGELKGFVGNVTLQNNGKDDLVVEKEGAFTFATRLFASENYAISVSVQPAGGECVVTNGQGQITTQFVEDVKIECLAKSVEPVVTPTDPVVAPPGPIAGTPNPSPGAVTLPATYTVGGTVTGLSGTLKMKLNGGSEQTITANGAFAFTQSLSDGAVFSPTVSQQPTHYGCAITLGQFGMIHGANVTNVTVVCSHNKFIFLSAASSNGAQGGVAGFDALCNADTARPDTTVTYSALMADNSRVACTSVNCGTAGAAENVNWPLSAVTSYEKADGTVIFTTSNKKTFLFPLLGQLDSTASGTYTGLTQNFQNDTANCMNWTSSSNADRGRGGRANASNPDFFIRDSATCDIVKNFYCVQN